MAVRRVKISADTSPPTWLSRNVLQVCGGGFLRLGIHRETVGSEASIPSFGSSRCTGGARRVRYEAKRFRYQRRPVSCSTITWASFQSRLVPRVW